MVGSNLKIPFFDAKAAYVGQQEKLDHVIQKVLSHGRYINGPEVSEFALNLASYLDVKQAIPCGNGTDALCLALMALDLNKGDEVIVPTFNFVSAAESIALLGLTPVFVEVDANSYNIDVDDLTSKITRRTRAIIVVHLFGLAAEMDRIIKLAKEYELHIIEDVAQALGGNYQGRKLGTFGKIGCTSFFPTKNLACFGDGGAVFTNDLLIATKIKMLANHGQQQKYEHTYIGLNSRLDTIQAAVLNVQLSHLDNSIQKRREIAAYYRQHLKNIETIALPEDKEDHTYNQFCILLKNKELRNSLKSFLAENGVDTMIYYPKPSHLQPAFSQYGFNVGDFPIAEALCNRILALPIYLGLTIENQMHMVDLIKSFINGTK